MQPNDGNDIVIVSTTQGYPAVRWLDSTGGFLYSYQPLTQSDDHCTAQRISEVHLYRRGICSISEKKYNFLFFSYLYSSHGFLSMIFGIFGKFGIDIGEQKYFSANIFDRKHF